MNYRFSFFYIILLLVFITFTDALMNSKVKKRRPKFLKTRTGADGKPMSTYSVSMFAASATSPPPPNPDSKVEIEILKAIDKANCPRKSQKGDKLVINYIGYLPDGTQFDSSFKKGKPTEFELGAGNVLPAWDQGAVGMCIGEVRKLSSPADLSAVQGSSVTSLTFKIELLEIVGYTLPDNIKRDEL